MDVNEVVQGMRAQHEAMRDEIAWAKLRAYVERERRSYAVALSEGRNKDARTVFAALEGAYGGILRKMDSLEAQS